jgi:outer membrane protein assembly factor BamB/tRNA A-37 threonylcarbamoyl transferase component Bud32
MLAPGTVLENRYEVQRVAGRGGMSTVYAARDLRFGQVERICAVKEMFDLDPDANVRALRLVNFERESALLATISHPAVPKIYDFFTLNGLVYLVLEFIDGQDLERLLDTRKTPFPEAQLRAWAGEICNVLATLHSHQPDPIIFRDLKPSNIMLRSTGQIALVDFGIARTIQGRQRGTMIGTEGYAPPEQYRGLADARGDIYALGATLHHLATNSDPRQETPFTFQDRPVRALNPDISEPFAAIIMKMLAYNPSDRYQSVAALQAELGASEARLLSIVSAATPAPPVAEEQPAAAAPAAPLARELRAAAERPAITKKRSARRKRVLETDAVGERIAWAAQTDDEVRGSAGFDGRAFAIGSYDGQLYNLAAADGAVRWRFRTGRGVVSRPLASDGVWYFGSEDATVYAVDGTTGEARWLQRTSMPVRSSPALGRHAVFIGSDDANIYAFGREDGKLLWRQRTWGPVRSSPVVEAGAVYCGCDDGYLYSLNAENGKVRWRAQCSGPLHATPLVCDDKAIVTSRQGYMTAFNLRGEKLWQFDAQAGVIASPRATRGLVIVATIDGALYGVNLEDGTTRWTARHANQITSTPLTAGERAYIGTVDGDCLCFSTVNGELIWRHQLGGAIVSTPAWGAGVLVVGSTDGRVFGLTVDDAQLEHDAALAGKG